MATQHRGWEVYHTENSLEKSRVAGKAAVSTGLEYQHQGEECTILCVPAVPAYFSPSDFLGFVGEKTREMVSHFRMVMTGQNNTYLVLMKFKDSEFARKWKVQWDGKLFNSIEVSLRIHCFSNKLHSKIINANMCL